MSNQGIFVCTDCIDEPGIREFIKLDETDGDCSFCEARSTSVAPLDDIAEHMKISLEYEYDDALEWFFFDHEEGGFIGKTWDTWELLTEEIELDLPNDYDGKIFQEIIDQLPQRTWCQADPYDVPGQEKVRYDWAWFTEVLTHRRRFFFEDYESGPHSANLSPGELLERIFQYTENYELFRTLPAGTRLLRARSQKLGEKHTTPQDLGPPPKEIANQANRMSPAGIAMFYACDNPETALRETAKKTGQFVIGEFETRRPAVILDLTDIPSIPSLFAVISDSSEFRPREVLSFLNHIADEISKPVQRDDRVHIEYIPTQVVTEFVRSKLTREGARVDGIKYQSAVHLGHSSYVIFATQDNLLSTEEGPIRLETDRWLELVTTRKQDVIQENIDKWKKEIPERYRRDYHRLLYGNDSTE